MIERTILIADDHPLVRRGLKSVLELIGITQVVEASNGIEALNLDTRFTIDLFILDFKMPIMNGYEAAKILFHRNPKAKIIIISMFDDVSLIANFFSLGVQGFLMKNTGIDEIEDGIERVLAGDIYYDPGLNWEAQRKQCFENQMPLNFTPRESELLKLLSTGRTSKEIADLWGLTLRTIETYRSRLLEKVRVKNTSELLTYIHKNGLY